MVAISHHHSDHYGGMEEVRQGDEASLFRRERLRAFDVLVLEALEDSAGRGGNPGATIVEGAKIELGSVELTVFPQPPEDHKEENNNSIGLRMSYGSFSALFTGDSEETERAWWLRNDPGLVRNCTILKVAHHGSRNGTDARWLQTVHPELAVASLGEHNDYGHPHSETVSLFRRTGIPFLRTDQLGSITITSDGRDWHVTEPQLGRAGRPTQADVDRVAAATADSAPRSRARTQTR